MSFMSANLSFEIAKALKDAGFKQPERDPHLEGDWVSIDLENAHFLDPDAIYAPSLEELIAALPRERTLPIIMGGKRNFPFQLIAHKNGWAAFYNNLNYEAVGVTPKEAVALLWLALQREEKIKC